MDTMVTTELTEAINAEVKRAVDEVVKDYLPTLDDYLAELDKGKFECTCTGEVIIRFLPDHRVTATIPLDVIEGYDWAFRTPAIEVEVDGTFENRYN